MLFIFFLLSYLERKSLFLDCLPSLPEAIPCTAHLVRTGGERFFVLWAWKVRVCGVKGLPRVLIASVLNASASRIERNVFLFSELVLAINCCWRFAGKTCLLSVVILLSPALKGMQSLQIKTTSSWPLFIQSSVCELPLWDQLRFPEVFILCLLLLGI